MKNRLRRTLKLAFSMMKIGCIGFGGGSALIPVIEKTVVEEEKLISKEEYDMDVMAASITPGALPVEIAAGVGRRSCGKSGLLVGASAMALPGVILTLFFMKLAQTVTETMSIQIGFITIGIAAFICSILTEYIRGTVQNAKSNNMWGSCCIVIVVIVMLTCGRNIVKLVPIVPSNWITLSTVQIFAIAFFVIFYTRCKFTWWNTIVSFILCTIFILNHNKSSYFYSERMGLVVKLVMFGMAIYGAIVDKESDIKVHKHDKTKKVVHVLLEVVDCIIFALFFSIPAFAKSQNCLNFVLKGSISSIMSFGGGDAYLTVADGLFVQSAIITETEFYNVIVPIVNILPGSILCKTLSAIGYSLGGLWCAVAGFAVSVAASCAVFRLIGGLYESYEGHNIFRVIKKWIRPIVSGLLINVMLGLIVQAKNCGGLIGQSHVCLLILLLLYILDIHLYNKQKWKNGKIVFVTCMLSVVICNVLFSV